MRPLALFLLCALLAACGYYSAGRPAPICEAPLDDGGCVGWYYPDSQESFYQNGDGGWRPVTGSVGGGFYTGHGVRFYQGDAGSLRCCGPAQLGNSEELFLDALGDNGWPRGASSAALSRVHVYAASGLVPCSAGGCLGLDTEESSNSDRIDLDVDPPNTGCAPEGIYLHELGHAIRHQLTGDGDSTHADLSVWRAVERVAGPYCAGFGG